jgi:uncharacterized protein (DUF427 family)/predicted amidophosphoribosyltransferase
VLDFVRTWLFPSCCVACDAPGPALCAGCAPSPRDAQAFSLEGIPCFALGAYDGALRRAIVAMKHGERDPLDLFADLLAARAMLEGVLVPLPTSRARAAERGFDQAVELARRLAARRPIACSLDLLRKRRGAQAGRNRHDRLAALDRFRIRRGAVLPARVTLLDDVCTTGATLRDAVRLLRGQGVEVCRIVVLARTSAGAGAPETKPYRERSLTHVKAMWKGAVLAESAHTEVVEGNQYFPPDAIKNEYFKPSETHSVCPWKGTASYYTVEVNGERNPDAAWFYPHAKDAAKNIEGYVAFWKGVEVTP